MITDALLPRNVPLFQRTVPWQVSAEPGKSRFSAPLRTKVLLVVSVRGDLIVPPDQLNVLVTESTPAP